MMRGKGFILIFFILFGSATHVVCQFKPLRKLTTKLAAASDVQLDPKKFPIKLMFRQTLGGVSQFNTVGNGFATDRLLSQKGSEATFQVASMAYFYKRRPWGLEINFSFQGAASLAKRPSFDDAITPVYENQYYVTPTGSSGFTGSSSIEKLVAGPAYKVEKNRWVFVGRLLAGVYIFNTETASYIFKSRDSNEVTLATWAPATGKGTSVTFLINPSLTIARRIFNHVAICVDVNYWQSKANFSYVETFRNINTSQIEIKNRYRYTNPIREVSISAGLMFTW